MNEKSMDPEYVTGRIIFLEAFWDDFVVWSLHRLKNLNMFSSLIKRFTNNY